MTETVSDKLCILAADDSRVILKAMHKILGSEYEILDARDGEEAWKILQNNDAVCAVFTDMQMPKLNGLELLKRIRGADDSNIKTLPVILVTSAEDHDNSVKESFSLGITDMVRKPFDSLMLQACARAHVKARPLNPAPDENAAAIDKTTKLANKSYFSERGEQDRAYAKRQNQPMAIALVAIDNFKTLNSEQPELIKPIIAKISGYIRAMIRKEDTLAYLAPGQFGVSILSIQAQHAHELLERVRDKIANKKFHRDAQEFSLTISIGLACTEGADDSTFAALVQAANKSLLEASKQGGNRILRYTSVSQEQQKFDSLFKILDQSLTLLEKNWPALEAAQAETVLLKLLPLLKKCCAKLNLDETESIASLEDNLKHLLP